jgi:hypothetical protein
MATLTLNLPDKLAERLEPFSRWLPVILEISLLKLKTPAAETASELVDFLASNPSVQAVGGYHASQRAQERTNHLLALNRAGVLGEADKLELDEMMQLEQLVRTLKAGLRETIRQ